MRQEWRLRRSKVAVCLHYPAVPHKPWSQLRRHVMATGISKATPMCRYAQVSLHPRASTIVCNAAVFQGVIGPRWFQLYVYKDRHVTADLVHRAEACGFTAIVLTVKLWTLVHTVDCLTRMMYTGGSPRARQPAASSP